MVVVTVHAQGEVVFCRVSNNCSGAPGDDLGVMTIEECCMNDTVNGRAFSEEESCTPCVGECMTLWHMFIKDIVGVIGFFILNTCNSLWIL